MMKSVPPLDSDAKLLYILRSRRCRPNAAVPRRTITKGKKTVANYKYQYNEDDVRPAEPVKEYKVKTALPNQTLITAIVSYFFFGWLGVVIAIYALQKVSNFHRENEGVKSKMITAAKILAIIHLVLSGLMYTLAFAYYFIIPIVYAPEEVSQLFTYIYPFI